MVGIQMHRAVRFPIRPFRPGETSRGMVRAYRIFLIRRVWPSPFRFRYPRRRHHPCPRPVPGKHDRMFPNRPCRRVTPSVVGRVAQRRSVFVLIVPGGERLLASLANTPCGSAARKDHSNGAAQPRCPRRQSLGNVAVVMGVRVRQIDQLRMIGPASAAAPGQKPPVADARNRENSEP